MACSPFEEIGFVIKITGCVELYSENTTIKVTRGAKVTLRPAILDEKGADVLNHVGDDITVSWEYTNTPSLTENILECKLDITESDAIMPVSRITWIIEFINIHCINSLPIRIIYTILSYFFISSMQLF